MAAMVAGLEETNTGHKLLESCLSERPQAGLREMWRQYIAIICTTLSAEERDTLKTAVMQQARTVAAAAGGFMGLGSKVSSEEAALLAEFAAAFDVAVEQTRS